MTSPLEYGQGVQNALREEIRDAMRHRDAKVTSLAALSRALGHGDARQYIASRFAADPKSGKVRDLTVPDVVAIGHALGIPAEELLRRAKEAADARGNVTQLPMKPAPSAVKRAARPDPRRRKPTMGDE